MAESLFPAALRHIVAAIEPEILIEAFGKKDVNPFAVINIPIEAHIEREVIIGQVVKDIQLFDSTETKISLDGLIARRISDGYCSLFIPENRRGGRDIMSVNGISYGFNRDTIRGDNSGAMFQSNLHATAASILGGVTRSMPDTEHDCTLIAPNTILVNDRFDTSNMATLHCNLTVDHRLTHIRNATSLPFIELCIWKTRQLCYTKLNIAMGRATIDRGKELGVFMEAVREFRDARTTYMELLNKFQITAKLNDPVARRNMIRARIPGRLIG